MFVGPKAHKKKLQAARLDVAKTLAFAALSGQKSKGGLNAKDRIYPNGQGMNRKPPVKSGDNFAEQVSYSAWMLSKAPSARAKANQPGCFSAFEHGIHRAKHMQCARAKQSQT